MLVQGDAEDGGVERSGAGGDWNEMVPNVGEEAGEAEIPTAGAKDTGVGGRKRVKSRKRNRSKGEGAEL